MKPELLADHAKRTGHQVYRGMVVPGTPATLVCKTCGETVR